MAKETRLALSEIMKLAWQMVKHFGFTMSEAMKKAWANAKLKVELRKGIVKFFFQKVDGSIRQAYGTLRIDLIPTHDEGSHRTPSEAVQVYFDTEKQSFRCFRKENLLGFGENKEIINVKLNMI